MRQQDLKIAQLVIRDNFLKNYDSIRTRVGLFRLLFLSIGLVCYNENIVWEGGGDGSRRLW